MRSAETPDSGTPWRSREVVLLAAVILLFALAVFFALNGRGFVDSDGLAYYRSARTDLNILRWILAGKSYELTPAIALDRFPPLGNFYGKPLLNLIYVAALALLGVGDRVLSLVNLLCGSLGLLFFYAAARRWADPGTAAWALAFLATSPVYLWLSSTDMPHGVQLLFFLAGVAFYARTGWLEWEGSGPPPPRPWIAGLLLGLALVTHLNTVIAAGVLILFDLTLSLRRHLSAAETAVRTAALVLPILACIGIMEAWLQIYRTLMGPEGHALIGSTPYGFMTYLEQLAFNFLNVQKIPASGTGVAGFSTKFIQKLSEYVYAPYLFEGAVRLTLAAAGMVWVAVQVWRSRTPTAVLVVLMAMGIYVIFFALPFFPFLRNTILALPFLALAFGMGISRYLHGGEGGWKPGIFLVVLLVASAWHIAPIYSVRSGFRGLGLLLKERGAKEAGILNGSSLAKSYLPVYGLGARGLTAARIPNYPGDYLVLLSRSSFLDAGPGGLNPSALRTCLARAGVRPAWKGQHITVYAAMDLAKRPYTPVLNGLMQKVLGREVRRRAREILLITVEDGRRLVEQFKKTNGKECRFLEGTERGLLREWPGVHAWREEFP